MAKRWYVVHAYSGYEKKVMHAQPLLSTQKATEGLGDCSRLPTFVTFVRLPLEPVELRLAVRSSPTLSSQPFLLLGDFDTAFFAVRALSSPEGKRLPEPR